MAQFDVTIDHTLVPARLTDFPVLIDLSLMPASFWSTVTNGGGDIRCADGALTVEYAREVVSCDTATETGELWVLVPSISASVDTVIKIDVDGARSDYATSATYGRDAVWADYVAVYHGDSTTDSTGNGGTLSGIGSGSKSVGSSTAKIGTAFSLGELGGYETTTAGGSLSSGGASTIQGWFRRTADTPHSSNFGEYLVVYGDSGVADGHGTGLGAVSALNDDLFTFTFGGNTSSTTSGAATALNTWYKFESVFDQAANTIEHYLQGDPYTSVASYTDNSVAGSTINFGLKPDLLNGFQGQFDEIRVLDSALDADWIKTEHNNQDSPGTFYAITEVGSGITATASMTQAADTISAAGTIALSGALTATQADQTISAAGSLPITGAVSATQEGDTISSSAVPGISGDVGVTQDSDTVESVAALSLAGSVSVTQEGDTVLSEGNLTATGSGSVAITQEDNLTESGAVLALQAELNQSQSDNTISAAGKLSIAASFSATQEGDTVSSAGSLGNIRSGAVSITQDDDTVSASGQLDLSGAVSVSQEGDTAAGSASLLVRGSVGVTQESDTAISFAMLGIRGVVVIDQDANSIVSSGGDPAIPSSIRTVIVPGNIRSLSVGSNTRIIPVN